uniref:Divalent cation transporter n=1 Tax=Ascaris lumbricoides TaxID=6252 RepID=A0A0M3I223_ASCLU
MQTSSILFKKAECETIHCSSKETRSGSDHEIGEKTTRDVVANSIDVLAQMGDVLYSKSNREISVKDGKTSSSYTRDADELAETNVMDERDLPAESSYVLFFEVLFPFLIAGFGMVLAGLVLDAVQHWELFVQVPETFILVPALLGLKGNLEMTLASRLSTLANMGRMDTSEGRWAVITTNLALIQVQAIVVAFLASSFAVVLAWIPKGQIDWAHVTLLCASSLTTASVASLLLSFVMITVVLISRCLHINPDNVATPIAASLGDLTTLAVLSLFGSAFLRAHLTESWLNVAVVVIFLLAAPLWAMAARRDDGAKDVLENGWSPIIFSMLISSTGGFILEGAIKRFPKIAVFQPVINGVGGNLAAVHASRLATFFHRTSTIGVLPYDWSVQRFYSFKRAFFSSEWDSRSARVLLMLVVPGHIIFNWLIRALYSGETPPSGALFTSLYLLAALLQVMLILYVCQWLVALMWWLEVDPDNAAIPYLTALGDLSGTFLLFITFLFLSWFQKNDIH